MKLPTKTEIFGIPYNISWHKTSKVNNVGGGALWGIIDYGPSTIRISKEVGERDRSVTLLEEILHGVFNEMDYDNLNEDHKFISPLVNGLYTALEKAGMIKKFK